MKAFIFCGYHNTGKTTFIKNLASELAKLGYSVAYLKHVTDPSTWKTKENLHDTETMLETGIKTSIALTEEVTVTYTKNHLATQRGNASSGERKTIRNTLKQLNADYVLIEGFKHYDGPIPKIIFGKSEEEILKLYQEIGNYGIYIGYTGMGIEEINREELKGLKHLSYTRNNVSFFTSLSAEYPSDIDCGECGVSSCREFITEVLNGKKSMSECKPLHGDIKLYINNNPVYLKSFVGNTLKDIIMAYIKNLHDVPPEGSIKILIK